jgi:hypothetical protein
VLVLLEKVHTLASLIIRRVYRGWSAKITKSDALPDALELARIQNELGDGVLVHGHLWVKKEARALDSPIVSL